MHPHFHGGHSQLVDFPLVHILLLLHLPESILHYQVHFGSLWRRKQVVKLVSGIPLRRRCWLGSPLNWDVLQVGIIRVCTISCKPSSCCRYWNWGEEGVVAFALDLLGQLGSLPFWLSSPKSQEVIQLKTTVNTQHCGW